MRKILLLLLIAILGTVAYLVYRHQDHAKKIADLDTISKDKDIEENEDGIMLAQKQEFEMTKDIALGYIPKSRLINAYQDLVKVRKSGPGARIRTTTGIVTPTPPSPITGLVWTERGSNSDGIGPSNGNTRGPGSAVTSGRMRAILVDKSDATNKTVWVGGIDGGIWKTTDITASPATWTLVNDFFGNLAIGSICQDPSNTNTMYFGTGEKAFNADAVEGGGVWKSTDHGVTWNLLPSTTGFWNVSKIICDGSGNIYVATLGNGNGIQRSTDGGATWTKISPTGMSSRMTDMKLSSTGRLHLIVGYFNSASPAGYRFTDNPATVTPATWTSPTTPFTPVQYNCELAVSGNTLYVLNANASYQTPQIYKSTDGGANWAATATSPPAASGSNDLSSGQGWYCLAIAIDPANSNNVIVGGLNCYKTADGGATWSLVSHWVGTTGNYIHADQHIAVWNGNQVLVGSDGGIFYSADGATTFADRNVNLRLKQFYSCDIHPTTTNYFLAGAQDNGCHQFTSAGLGGSVEVTGGDGAFVHIDQDQPQYQFGSYVYSQYRRSTDGGSTWSSVNYSNSAGQFINPTDYDNSNNIMYTGGIAGQYVRWENPQTGSTFTPISIAAFGTGFVTHVMVSPYTSNRVFFGTDGGKVIMTDNANQAAPVVTDITGSTMSASTVSSVAIGTTDNNLIATFSNYGSIHVWASTTGGGAAGWTNITGNLPDIPVRWALFDPEDNTKAFIATDMGVYETSNINGASTLWSQDPGFPTVRTDMLKYRKSDGTLAAATHGRGLWTTTIPFGTPYIRFSAPAAYTTQQETTVSTTGCRGYKDYTVNMSIDLAPAGNANVNLTVAAGATATRGVDYDFTTNGSFATPSSTLLFASGSATPQPITVRVYDDADIENTESFTLNYNVTGTTNAQAAPSSPAYTFYINDNDAAPVSTTNPIETALNASKNAYLGPGQDVPFYNTNGDIIGRIKSLSATDFGCTTMTIDRAGNGASPFWYNTPGNYLLNKTFHVVPTTNDPSGQYQITLYFTAAERTAWETATGALWSNIQIVKVPGQISQVTPATPNAAGTPTIVTPVFGTYGSDNTLTFTFTNGFSGFGAGIPGASPLPITLLSFTGALNSNNILLNWSTSSEQNSKYFEIQKSSDGSNFYPIGTVNAAGNSTSKLDYQFTDLHINQFNYYRLQMTDLDGKYVFSNIVLIRNDNASQNAWVVNNPFKSYIDVRLAKAPQGKIRFDLTDMKGARIYSSEPGQATELRLDLSGVNLPTGAYILRIMVDGKPYTYKVLKQ